MGLIVRLVNDKNRVAEEIAGALTKEGLLRALRDPHSKRPPRPCGITIHTGVGCSFGCSYCYVYDMGFPARPRPYDLSPLELVYALAVNPYVIPTATLAAYGSVTEPFLAETRDVALSYIKHVSSWLKLPSQASTKACIDKVLANALKEAEPNLSLLVSVTTIDKAPLLEGGAPPPLKRLLGAQEALKAGIHVTLFVRPIIPTVTESEAEKILKLAAEYNIKNVVFGGFRVTYNILSRIKAKGVDVSAISNRMSATPRGPRDQVELRIGDIKRRLAALASDMGFTVFPSACAANVWAHDLYCWLCSRGPCGSIKRATPVNEEDVEEYLESLGLRCRCELVSEGGIDVTCERPIPKRALLLIETITKRVVRVKLKGN